MSTNTGLALSLAILPAVATKVNGVVMTSSPLSTSTDMRESSKASDPDAQPMAKVHPINLASSASNFSTSGPMMNCWLSRTLCTAARVCSCIVAYSAFRSINGNNGLGDRVCGVSADLMDKWFSSILIIPGKSRSYVLHALLSSTLQTYFTRNARPLGQASVNDQIGRAH